MENESTNQSKRKGSRTVKGSRTESITNQNKRNIDDTTGFKNSVAAKEVKSAMSSMQYESISQDKTSDQNGNIQQTSEKKPITAVSPRCSERLKRKFEESPGRHVKNKRTEDNVTRRKLLCKDKNEKQFGNSLVPGAVNTKSKKIPSDDSKKDSKNKNLMNENQNKDLLNQNGQNKELLNYIKEQIQSCSIGNTNKQNQDEELQNVDENDEMITEGPEVKYDHTYQSMLKRRIKRCAKEEKTMSLNMPEITTGNQGNTYTAKVTDKQFDDTDNDHDLDTVSESDIVASSSTNSSFKSVVNLSDSCNQDNEIQYCDIKLNENQVKLIQIQLNHHILTSFDTSAVGDQNTKNDDDELSETVRESNGDLDLQTGSNEHADSKNGGDDSDDEVHNQGHNVCKQGQGQENSNSRRFQGQHNSGDKGVLSLEETAVCDIGELRTTAIHTLGQYKNNMPVEIQNFDCVNNNCNSNQNGTDSSNEICNIQIKAVKLRPVCASSESTIKNPESKKMKSLLWTGSDLMSKMMNFEVSPEQLLEFNSKKSYSVLKNVNDVTLLTPGDVTEILATNKSDPVSVSGTTSSPLTVNARLSSYDQAAFTSEMVEKEIEDDVVFGPVSAVIKSTSMTSKDLIDMVERTGITLIKTDNKQTVIQGSWKSLNRAFDLLKNIQGLKNNAKTSSSTDHAQKTQNTSSENYKIDLSPESNIEVISTAGCNTSCNTNLNQSSVVPVEELSQSDASMPLVLDCNSMDTSDGMETNKTAAVSDNAISKIKTKLSVEPNITDNNISKTDKPTIITEKQFANMEAGFKCDHCDRNFWTQALLQGHMEQKHGPNLCQLCGKVFACKRYLQMHTKRHANVRRFECEICGWKFMERHKLKLHLESHKSSDERVLPYRCAVCQKQFYNKAGWSDHMNTHTGNRPFKCNQCDASFAHRIGLRRHLVVHSKNKPFMCPHCNKGFPFKSKLDAHLTMHTGLSRHSCELCGKIFTVSSSLKRHMESCQGKEASNIVYINEGQLNQSTVDMINATVSDPEAVYMCGICGSMFNSLDKAGSHTATHEPCNDIQEQQLVDTAAYHEIVTAQIDMTESQKSCHVLETAVLPNL